MTEERKLGRRALFTRFFSIAGEEARAARLSAAEALKQATEDLRPATEDLRPAAGDLPPATGDLRPATGDEAEAQVDADATAAPPQQVVMLQAAACIAYRGTLCTVCVERCPEPGAIVTAYGRPSIVSETCTGCGDCVAHCPAPINALLLRDR